VRKPPEPTPIPSTSRWLADEINAERRFTRGFVAVLAILLIAVVVGVLIGGCAHKAPPPPQRDVYTETAHELAGTCDDPLEEDRP
jgi:hypothetical protein